MLLSNRPGRSKAGSMRSGRLWVNTHGHRFTHRLPGRSEHIDPVKPLSSIHLSQELIDHAICDSGRVMPSARVRYSHVLIKANQPLRRNGVKLVKE